jgi:hypothetical protein
MSEQETGFVNCECGFKFPGNQKKCPKCKRANPAYQAEVIPIAGDIDELPPMEAGISWKPEPIFMKSRKRIFAETRTKPLHEIKETEAESVNPDTGEITEPPTANMIDHDCNRQIIMTIDGKEITTTPEKMARIKQETYWTDEKLTEYCQAVKHKYHSEKKWPMIFSFKEKQSEVTITKPVAGFTAWLMEQTDAAEVDFVIFVSLEIWQNLPDHLRQAAIDHALSHCFKDEDKAICIEHDLEEFLGVFRRHGAYGKELQAFVQETKQLKLFEEEIK